MRTRARAIPRSLRLRLRGLPRNRVARFASAWIAAAALVACGAGDDGANSSNKGASSTNPLAPESDVFVGAWGGGSTFRGIVFLRDERGPRFFADVAPDARCVGCPAKLRIDGTYSVVSGGVRLETDLAPFAEETEAVRESIRTYWSGRYTTHLVGTSLTLSRGEPVDTVERAASYCDAPSDCDPQGVAKSACDGALACAASTCSFVCADVPPVTEPEPPIL